MAFLDGLTKGNAPSVAQTPQVEAAQRSVESLPDNVKAQAVEAARPAARLIDQARGSSAASGQPQVPQGLARGRGLGMER